MSVHDGVGLVRSMTSSGDGLWSDLRLSSLEQRTKVKGGKGALKFTQVHCYPTILVGKCCPPGQFSKRNTDQMTVLATKIPPINAT